jgi:hypothetical protein
MAYLVLRLSKVLKTNQLWGVEIPDYLKLLLTYFREISQWICKLTQVVW